MYILKKLCFLLLLGQAKSFLSDVETKIFVSIAKSYHVKDCFIAPEETPDAFAVEIVKKLSEYFIFTVFIKRENLRKFLEKMDSEVYRLTAVVLKEKSLNSLDYFSNKTIISLFFWLLFDGSNGTLREELVMTEIPHNSELFFVEKKEKGNYMINEYYKIKKDFPGVIQLVSEWKNNKLITGNTHWYERKSNMHGYEFVTVKFNESLYLSPKEKVNEALWEELSELLNFKIKSRIIQYDPKHATNGFFTEEEEAFLDTQIYIRSDDKYRLLLGPTTQSGLYMHIKAAGEYKGFMRFIKPFTKYTWQSIGYWICCCGFFRFIVEYFSRKFGCSDKPLKDSFQSAFTPLDSICSQNGTEISGNLSSRFMVILIRTSANVIFYAYSATFISYLLLYIPELPFTDLRGFVENGNYKIIGERNSDIDTYFNVSGQPLETLVHKKFLSDVTKWSRLDKEVDRMCAGEKLVLVAYDDDIDKYRPCNIVKIKKPLKIFVNGFKIRFRSPFRGILQIKLLLLRTTGILKRVNSHILYHPSTEYKENVRYEINFDKVAPVYKIFFYGCLLSMGILKLELLSLKLIAFCGRKRKHPKKIGVTHSKKHIKPFTFTTVTTNQPQNSLRNGKIGLNVNKNLGFPH